MRDEWVLKICAAGSYQVRKTSLIRRNAEDKFEESYSPIIGVDVTVKRITIDDQAIKLLLWDTAGQEVFGRIRPMYFEGAFSCIFFYAKNSEPSFEYIKKLYHEFATNERKNTQCAVIGIKNGPERITRKIGEKLAQKINSQYYEMTREDTDAFTTVITDTVKKYLGRIGKDERIRLKIQDLAKLKYIGLNLATLLVDKGIMKDIFIKWTREEYYQFKTQIPVNYRSTLGRAFNFHHKY